eukprot:4913291-Ditylum_brightwellii.AAC.1
MSCRIPTMQVSEGGSDEFYQSREEHKDCLHDHHCLLSTRADLTDPCWGLRRRSARVRFKLPEEDIHQLVSSGSEVDQQPTYDISYPAGLTVIWQKNNKVRLATVIGSGGKTYSDNQEPFFKINVPNLSLLPCTTPDSADIPTSVVDVDPNAMEELVSRDDLKSLWHKDQTTLSDDLRLYLHWHQRLQHPSHITMVRLSERNILPSAFKYVKRAPPCAACLFAKAQRRAWRTKGKDKSSIRKAHHNKPGKGTSADHIISHQL